MSAFSNSLQRMMSSKHQGQNNNGGEGHHGHHNEANVGSHQHHHNNHVSTNDNVVAIPVASDDGSHQHHHHNHASNNDIAIPVASDYQSSNIPTVIQYDANVTQDSKSILSAASNIVHKLEDFLHNTVTSNNIDNVLNGVSNSVDVIANVITADSVVSSVENAVTSVSGSGTTTTGAVTGVSNAIETVAGALANATASTTTNNADGTTTTTNGGKLSTFVHNAATFVEHVADVVPTIASTVISVVGSVSSASSSSKPSKKDKKNKKSGNKKKAAAPVSNKRALLVGLNYKGTGHDLSGCITDVNNVYDYLTKTAGFAPSDIVTLVDEATIHTGSHFTVPTKANMIAAFKDLTAWALKTLASNGGKPLEIFFQYSGHGTDVADTNGDEADGRDECFVPHDFGTAGFLSDDVYYDEIVTPLGALDAGRNLINFVGLIDACRSGTIGDLPINWKSGSTFGYSNASAWKKANGDYKTYIASFGPLPRIVLLSGCNDDQYSTDLGRRGGALTSTLLHYLNSLAGRQTPSWESVMNYLTSALKKYNQTPDLSSSFALDVRAAFGKSFGVVAPTITGASKDFGDEDDDEEIPTYNEPDTEDEEDQATVESEDEDEEQEEPIAEEDDVEEDPSPAQATASSSPSATSTVTVTSSSERDYLIDVLAMLSASQSIKRVTVYEFDPRASDVAATKREIVTSVPRPTPEQAQQILAGLASYYAHYTQ